MKKTLLLAAIAFGAMSASAQVVEQPGFFDNWSIGVDGGVTTPMTGHAFFRAMRPVVGLHIDKQITPAFAMGVEGNFGINALTNEYGVKSATTFDNSYVGLYSAVNLNNLFAGYNCGRRFFTVEAVAGAGWGHTFVNKMGASDFQDHNFFATKAGLNFNFNVTDNFTVSVKPSVVWDMSDANVKQTSAAYDIHKAMFNIQAGLTYHFGNGFQCVRPYDQAEIDGLNGQINDLRAQLDNCTASLKDWESRANACEAALKECQNRPVVTEVVKEQTTNLNSVRFVFFRIGSSVITADQQPNIEMIAAFLKNHPNAKVVVKGYASQDGPLELNEKLAAARAESVKKALMSRYKIAADRIVAEGEGIGHMFEEESWNRVSICTIENAQ